jgi:uracil-DNA glycosylase
MPVKLQESWKIRLAAEFDKPYFTALTEFVRLQYATKGIRVYPAPKHIFAALDAVPFEDVRVVILGQDPYHGPGQAHGLSFSVPDGVQIPPSLQNIYKEIRSDLGIEPPTGGNLSGWTAQGVLLLNAMLTVEAGKAGSHQKKGWEEFTDAVIRSLNDQRDGIVFMLWGAYAQKKGAHIDCKRHLVLTSVHPSPLSAYGGFFGCGHFSKANAYLKSRGTKEIDWGRRP